MTSPEADRRAGNPSGVLPRARLSRLLDTAAQRRVTLVVAGGGFEKVEQPM
ncbi:MAG: hypothetical protein H7Y15_18940 [Pseudonocardia sp.]|nr:hypothetical protein [Pseudonocardia sp.]